MKALDEYMTLMVMFLTCVNDKNHTRALRIKNTSESDPRSYEVT